MALELSRRDMKPRLICDVCKRPITDVARGAVVHTYPSAAKQPIAFKFVHFGSCANRENYADAFAYWLELSDFLGYLNYGLKGNRRKS